MRVPSLCAFMTVTLGLAACSDDDTHGRRSTTPGDTHTSDTAIVDPTVADTSTGASDATAATEADTVPVDAADTGPVLGAALVSGDGQEALIQAEAAELLVVRVTDAAGAARPDVPVYVEASEGAAVSPATARTTLQGTAAFRMRAGRASGTYTFYVRVDPAAPYLLAVNLSAVAPPADTLYPIANAARGAGDGVGVPGPISVAELGAVRGLALAADGTLYLTAGHRVLRASPRGALSVVAGDGQAGFAGDLGPAAAARLSSPSGLALDAASGVLYVADTNNDRIRGIALASGLIVTVAGGAATPDPTHGDGGPATSASLQRPAALALDPDGGLWIHDAGHSRLRAVDPVSGLITTPLVFANPGCASADAALTVNLYTTELALAFDDGGALFIAGSIACGGAGNGNGPTPGVVRRDADGRLAHIAGLQGGAMADGVAATTTSFADIRGLAFDEGGNLYVATTDHRVRRIDGTTGVVATVVGQAAAGAGGLWGPAAAGALTDPGALVYGGGQLYIAERAGVDVRAVFALSGTATTSATLARVGADPSALVTALAPPLVVAVRDDEGPVGGVAVDFATASPGVALLGAPRVATSALNGQAAIALRTAKQAGVATVTASAADIHGDPLAGSPVAFTVATDAPEDGTLLTAVGVDHTAGFTEGAAPATVARIGPPRAVVFAPDGTGYLAAGDAVYALSPAGVLERIAGGASPGFAGDFGDARTARLAYPAGLALDAEAGRLYVADGTNQRVRVIDLEDGTIVTVAGGGTATAPGYGDGQPATSATLGTVAGIALSPAGDALYVNHLYVGLRRVDLGSGVITRHVAYRAPGPGCTQVDPVVVIGGYQSDGPLAVAPDGGLYLATTIACGGSGGLGNGPLEGIVHVAPDGALTRIAGKQGGAVGADVPADEAAFTAPVRGLVHHAGALWLTSGNVVRRLDLAENRLVTVAGTGASGFGGDFGPALAGELAAPLGLAFDPSGHLAIAASGSHQLRWIWRLAPTP